MPELRGVVVLDPGLRVAGAASPADRILVSCVGATAHEPSESAAGRGLVTERIGAAFGALEAAELSSAAYLLKEHREVSFALCRLGGGLQGGEK